MKRTFLLIMIITLVPTLTLSLTSCTKYDDYFYKSSNKVFSAQDEIFTKGYSTDNLGRDLVGKEVDRLTSVVPNERQLEFLELEYYNFIHFGMNTFTGKEWGTGKESPSKFNPSKIDTDQWCKVLKASNSKGIIFTAKHHDGFCLWQTETTNHSIKNSPYKNGKGDIVKELSDSCKKYGLKFGIYLSPWDMNAECYGKNEYNDFFKKQLTELVDGRYGELFSVWFDGARGKGANIDKDFEYDMAGYEEIIYKYQPKCVSVVQGSDVRWVGNEAGVSRENEWSVISEGADRNLQFQDDVNGADKLQSVKYDASDVGSRELLAKYKNLIFKPAEVDVSIHKGWFYHPLQRPKKLEHLLKIYYKSVGGNSSLLLNVCPSKKGIIENKDAERLQEFGNSIAKSKANKINITSITVGDNKNRRTLSNDEMNGLLDEKRYTNYAFGQNEYIIDLQFDHKQKVKRVDLREDLRYSQRIEAFDIYAKVDGGYKILANANNVGNRRTVMLDKDNLVTTDSIRIVLRGSRNLPVLRFIGIYA